MNRMLIGLLIGALAFAGSVRAQEFTQAPADLPRLDGADLFIDLTKYAGKQVVITDAEVFATSNSGAILHAGGVTFRVTIDGMDRETFRYFLKNCPGTTMTTCKVRLLATPTGKIVSDWPELANVKIVRP